MNERHYGGHKYQEDLLVQLRDEEPSCSVAEALERQEPFVNATLANHALALLARLFRYGRISYQGGFVSLAETARGQPLPIGPEYWKKLRKKAH